MHNVFKFIDHFYPTSPKENFEFCFYGRLFSKNERGIPQKDKITIIVKNHNDALPMFCYFNYGDFGETAAFIEDKTHIKLICEPEIEFYSLNPEIFHFSICSLFREKLMDLLNEFTYLELTSIQPFLQGNDRSELIGLIDLAINGYRKLKASVYLSEDDDFLGGKNQSSKNSKELVEDLDLHFLMDIKEILIKHPDFLSNTKEVVAFDDSAFKESIIDTNECQYNRKIIYSLNAVNSKKPIANIGDYIKELNDLCNYLPNSPELKLFRKNEWHYSLKEIELELKEINVGGILTKHNKFYSYDSSIQDYILDEIVSEIAPYIDDSDALDFKFRGCASRSYIDLFLDDKLYFLDRACALSLLTNIKKLNDARKRDSLMKMIYDLCDDSSSNLLADIEQKISWGQEMLREIRRTLVLELEKNQETNVI
jgi:hypothetical protein